MSGYHVPKHARRFDHAAWLVRLEEVGTHVVCTDQGTSWCLPSCREQWHGGMHAAWRADELATRVPHDEGCDA